MEQYEQAIEDCTKLIEINPTYAEAYNLRGKCFEAMGDETRAREDFFKCEELHCEHETDPYYKFVRYGELYRKRGDYARAIEKFSEAITLKPESAQVYEMRGGCFDALGDTVRAKENFSKAEAIRSAPRKKDAWEVRKENKEKLYSEYLNLARAADKNQDYAAAVEYYTKALENFRDSYEAEAYIERCKVYCKTGNELQALKDMNRAVDYVFLMNENWIGNWFKRSFYCDDLDGNFNEHGRLECWRIDKYLDVITPIPNDADALNNRGLAFIEIENCDAAIDCFTAAMKISPNFAIGL